MNEKQDYTLNFLSQHAYESRNQNLLEEILALKSLQQKFSFTGSYKKILSDLEFGILHGEHINSIPFALKFSLIANVILNTISQQPTRYILALRIKTGRVIQTLTEVEEFGDSDDKLLLYSEAVLYHHIHALDIPEAWYQKIFQIGKECRNDVLDTAAKNIAGANLQLAFQLAEHISEPQSALFEIEDHPLRRKTYWECLKIAFDVNKEKTIAVVNEIENTFDRSFLFSGMAIFSAQKGDFEDISPIIQLLSMAEKGKTAITYLYEYLLTYRLHKANPKTAIALLRIFAEIDENFLYEYYALESLYSDLNLEQSEIFKEIISRKDGDKCGSSIRLWAHRKNIHPLEFEAKSQDTVYQSLFDTDLALAEIGSNPQIANQYTPQNSLALWDFNLGLAAQVGKFKPELADKIIKKFDPHEKAVSSHPLDFGVLLSMFKTSTQYESGLTGELFQHVFQKVAVIENAYYRDQAYHHFIRAIETYLEAHENPVEAIKKLVSSRGDNSLVRGVTMSWLLKGISEKWHQLIFENFDSFDLCITDIDCYKKEALEDIFIWPEHAAEVLLELAEKFQYSKKNQALQCLEIVKKQISCMKVPKIRNEIAEKFIQTAGVVSPLLVEEIANEAGLDPSTIFKAIRSGLENFVDERESVVETYFHLMIDANMIPGDTNDIEYRSYYNPRWLSAKELLKTNYSSISQDAKLPAEILDNNWWEDFLMLIKKYDYQQGDNNKNEIEAITNILVGHSEAIQILVLNEPYLQTQFTSQGIRNISQTVYDNIPSQPKEIFNIFSQLLSTKREHLNDLHTNLIRAARACTMCCSVESLIGFITTVKDVDMLTLGLDEFLEQNQAEIQTPEICINLLHALENSQLPLETSQSYQAEILGKYISNKSEVTNQLIHQKIEEVWRDFSNGNKLALIKNGGALLRLLWRQQVIETLRKINTCTSEAIIAFVEKAEITDTEKISFLKIAREKAWEAKENGDLLDVFRLLTPLDIFEAIRTFELNTNEYMFDRDEIENFSKYVIDHNQNQIEELLEDIKQSDKLSIENKQIFVQELAKLSPEISEMLLLDIPGAKDNIDFASNQSVKLIVAGKYNHPFVKNTIFNLEQSIQTESFQVYDYLRLGDACASGQRFDEAFQIYENALNNIQFHQPSRQNDLILRIFRNASQFPAKIRLKILEKAREAFDNLSREVEDSDWTIKDQIELFRYSGYIRLSSAYLPEYPEIAKAVVQDCIQEIDTKREKSKHMGSLGFEIRNLNAESLKLLMPIFLEYFSSFELGEKQTIANKWAGDILQYSYDYPQVKEILNFLDIDISIIPDEFDTLIQSIWPWLPLERKTTIKISSIAKKMYGERNNTTASDELLSELQILIESEEFPYSVEPIAFMFTKMANQKQLILFTHIVSKTKLGHEYLLPFVVRRAIDLAENKQVMSDEILEVLLHTITFLAEQIYATE